MPEYAVHQYHVVRRKYIVSAASPEAAASHVDSHFHELTPVQEEDAEEVQPDVLVDLLDGEGRPVYADSLWLNYKDGQFYPG